MKKDNFKKLNQNYINGCIYVQIHMDNAKTFNLLLFVTCK